MDGLYNSLMESQLLNGMIAFLFAALIAFVSTPLVRVLAFRIGAVDIPEDDRRMHKIPTPRLGGLAIFFSFVLTVFLFYKPTNVIFAMVLGGILIVGLGIIDDIIRMRAVIKLIVHIAAAMIVISQGVMIERINLFGTFIEFGLWGIPITVLWIAGLINAINLIDGLDGLACGISSISMASLLMVTLIMGEPYVALITAIIMGACLGFLPFNKNPAKIFMGDTGSTFLGFILAVISVQGVFKVNAVVTFVIPFLILGLPIFDTAFAIVRRIISGRSPGSPDREHLHHRLIDMGFNQKQTVKIMYAISALLGISAIMLTGDMLIHALVIITVSLGLAILTWLVIRGEKSRVESGLIDSEETEAGKKDPEANIEKITEEAGREEQDQ